MDDRTETYKTPLGAFLWKHALLAFSQPDTENRFWLSVLVSNHTIPASFLSFQERKGTNL